jgi:hypothetical protein
MKISQTIALKNPYIHLAQSMVNCTSYNECVTVLVQDDNYQLIYPVRKIDNLQNQLLYHFIRSRIAKLQNDYPWFQKETKSLIHLCLENESSFAYFFNKLGEDQLFYLLSSNSTKQHVQIIDDWEESLNHSVLLKSKIKTLLLRLSS